MLPRITTLLLVAAALLLTPFAGSAEDKDGWISLFNGKDFDGWKIGDAKQGKWKIENGNIVANGPRSHLYTIKEFKNFEFKAEVMTTPGSNSGIYFHTKYQETGFPNTGYESQVNVSHGDPVKTGSLWGVVKLYETPAKDNKWWEQHIIVRGQNIVVKINGKTVLDYTEPKGVQAAARSVPAALPCRRTTPRASSTTATCGSSR